LRRQAQGTQLPLDDFLARAASFQDDPQLGDGGTVLERHPPTIKVSSDGIAEGLTNDR